MTSNLQTSTVGVANPIPKGVGAGDRQGQRPDIDATAGAVDQTDQFDGEQCM